MTLSACNRRALALLTPFTVLTFLAIPRYSTVPSANLDQLHLALQREDQQLVLGAAAGPQLERQEGLALERRSGVLLSSRSVAEISRSRPTTGVR